MSDVLDILDVERLQNEVNKEIILAGTKKKNKASEAQLPKRPHGMHREVYNLLSSDNSENAAAFLTNNQQGYKTNKANLGSKRVRPWKWTPFTNPARKDGAVFHHWQCEDEQKEYPFAKLNKSVDIPNFTDVEYDQHLQTEGWSRQETDHLMDLCIRFDLRFVIIQDRWDRSRFPNRSIEDIKERYYNIYNSLEKVRSIENCEPKLVHYDADYERKRKEQLIKLYNRTPEQLEEEKDLLNELSKMEIRKKQREKSTKGLQSCITTSDCTQNEHRLKKKAKKKLPQIKDNKIKKNTDADLSGIKFHDYKGSGVTLRSQRMRLPATLGQRKVVAIGSMLAKLNIENNPIPTEDVCIHFNELRSDIVHLNEIKVAVDHCEFELESLKHQAEIQFTEKTKKTEM